ncbi:type IV secretion protein Rhs [Opitutaceae bacterium TAV5]|nr:type IV secretion protein Rhs [Opitutaceae bacterium TAV5]
MEYRPGPKGIVFEHIPEPGVAGEAACGTPKTGSMHMELSLGATWDGANAGYIKLLAEQMNEAAFSPGSLIYQLLGSDGSVKLVRDDEDVVRQVHAPDADILIEDLAGGGFAIRFYAPGSDFATLTSSWHFVPATAGDFLQMQIRRMAGGGNQVYTFGENNGVWSLNRDGLATETLEKTTENGLPVEIRTLKEINGTVVSREKTTYETGPNGFQRKIESVLNPDSATDAQTTRWHYFPGTDRLDYVEYPDGRWERYTYTPEGEYHQEIMPWLDSLRTDADLSSHHYFETTREQITVNGQPVKLVTRTERIAGQEVGRRYALTWLEPVPVALGDTATTRTVKQVWEVDAATPGAAWDAPGNLVTKIDYDLTNNKRWRTLRPDGIVTLETEQPSVAGGYLAITQTGTVDDTGWGVADGTIIYTETNGRGLVIREEVRDIKSREIISLRKASAYENDDAQRGRPVAYTHLDGTTEELEYACCGQLLRYKDRDGIETLYTYDSLGRLVNEMRNGIQMQTTLDAAGRAVKTTRIGTDGSSIVQSMTAYDLAGRTIWTEDALGNRTTYTYDKTPAGGEISIITTPDGAPTTTTSHRDGRTLSVTGTTARPEKMLYGVTSAGLRWTQEIATGSEGEETEWTRTLTNPLGQTVRREYPDGAAETFGYNAKGQLVRQTDADGVQTLFAWNDKGEQTVTALDINRNGSIDYTGPDRIQRTVTEIATRGEAPASTTPVRRTVSESWMTETDTPTVITTVDTTLDGQQTWTTTNGLTTHTTLTQDGAGNRTETVTAPDGTQTIRMYSQGRLAGETRKDANGDILSEVTYAYDPHGRLSSQTMTGVGTTTYSYSDDDQVASVTAPDPGDGAQTTRYTYNNRGWQSKVTYPDGTETETTYYPTGQVKRTWGARTYPSEYTYDAQGRLRTLTTWKDFAGTAGEAVTTWNYDPQRGWLLNKRYADNQGPTYTYTPAGRLATRAWARGVVTTYGYTDAGGLASVTYSDSTPTVTYTYTRSGQILTTSDAAGLLTRTYDDNRRLTSETYSGTGLLSGKSLTRTWDALQRPSGYTATDIPAVIYTYDAGSHLATLAQGTHSATYTYHPHLGAVTTTTIRNNGTERVRQERTFDALGRITRVDTLGNGSILHARRDYTYNAANQRTQVTHEDSRSWNYGYDALGQLTSAEKRLADASSLPGYAFGYTFDVIGNRTQTVTNGRVASYTSNTLNQYEQRDVPAFIDVRGSANVDTTVLANDHLTTRTEADFFHALAVDNMTNAAQVSLKVQAVKKSPEQVATELRDAFLAKDPEALTYDADGNLTEDGLWDYTWDAENRLVAMETRLAIASLYPNLKQRLEFAYDDQARRIRKVAQTWNQASGLWSPASDIRFLYDGWNLLAEYDALNGGSVTRSYTWGLDLSETIQEAGGVGGLLWTTAIPDTYAPGYDANGNIVIWIDVASGSPAGQYEYCAFGSRMVATGTNGELPFGFSTKYHDTETALLYYGYRYYSPNFGRWINRDIIEEDGGINLYGFPDPVNTIDPHGSVRITIKKIDVDGNDLRLGGPAGRGRTYGWTEVPLDKTHHKIDFYNDDKKCECGDRNKLNFIFEISSYRAKRGVIVGGHKVSAGGRSAILAHEDKRIKVWTHFYKGMYGLVEKEYNKMKGIGIGDACQKDWEQKFRKSMERGDRMIMHYKEIAVQVQAKIGQENIITGNFNGELRMVGIDNIQDISGDLIPVVWID